MTTDYAKLFDLWFPGRGQEAQRPQVVPGTWKASYDLERDLQVVAARVVIRNHSRYIEGRGHNSTAALEDWLAKAEDEFNSFQPELPF